MRAASEFAGHIASAIHLDLWGVSLIDTDPAPLKAFLWMIEHVLAVHGVDATTRTTLADAQTSGGLLIAVAEDQVDALVKRLQTAGTLAAVPVGRFVEGTPGRIRIES